ncbi:MAG: ribonuclease III [Desulfuromonadales bacterium]|nr:ribonuclease III [Desulfuromonadales bacterium]NIR33980.1 ribonuclease III [Desulfuromonadales bacterium]NIS42652.1 ribonuclease III [Desulfuromonadales bacterium]
MAKPENNITRGLQRRIGYDFADPAILTQALTHKSFSNESAVETPHNERLEFLGDAVLDLIVSQDLFARYPQLPEGELTRIRAEAVSEKSLAVLARDLGLGPALRLGRGESISGGADKDSLLADALEAVLGAVFCDSGYDRARQVVEALFRGTLDQAVRGEAGNDFKTRLQELFQARYGHPPEYVLSRIEGPDHRRIYTVDVVLDGRTIGSGQAGTKKGAEQEAAGQALRRQDG